MRSVRSIRTPLPSACRKTCSSPAQRLVQAVAAAQIGHGKKPLAAGVSRQVERVLGAALAGELARRGRSFPAQRTARRENMKGKSFFPPGISQ